MEKLCKAILVDSKTPVKLGDIMKCIKLSPIYNHDIDIFVGGLVINVNPNIKESNEYWQKQELVFISSDSNEEIDEGHLVYFGEMLIEVARISIPNDTVTFINPLDNKIQTIVGINRFKKVIAIQSQIPELYIQQFMKQYNAGKIEDVKIKMEEEGDDVFTGRKSLGYTPKLTNGFVIINTKSNIEKQADLVEEIGFNNLKKEPILIPLLYTEEEVLRLLNKLRQDIYPDSDGNCSIHPNGQYLPIMLVDWFEQNKKK